MNDDSGPFYVEASTAPPKPPYGSPERAAFDAAALADAIDRLENPARWIRLDDDAEWPDGHPCRDCDRLYKDHSADDTECEGWR